MLYRRNCRLYGRCSHDPPPHNQAGRLLHHAGIAGVGMAGGQAMTYRNHTVNAPILRFHALHSVLMDWPYPTPAMRLKRSFSALLHVLAQPNRNLSLAGSFDDTLRLSENSPSKAIDGNRKTRQYAAIGFNQPTSREKLAHIGRQAAIVSMRLSGVFTSASPSFTFHGRQGQGRAYALLVRYASFSPLALCLPPTV